MSDMAADVIDDLQEFYGRKLNEVATRFYIACLSSLNENDLSRAWIVLKQKERMFPTVDKIKEYTSEARDERLKREKAREPIYPELEKVATSELGIETIQMMQDLYAHRLTRKQYLAKMFEMDVKYPAIGWRKAANELKAFWESEPERHAIGAKILEHQAAGRGRIEKP